MSLTNRLQGAWNGAASAFSVRSRTTREATTVTGEKVVIEDKKIPGIAKTAALGTAGALAAMTQTGGLVLIGTMSNTLFPIIGLTGGNLFEALAILGFSLAVGARVVGGAVVGAVAGAEVQKQGLDAADAARAAADV